MWQQSETNSGNSEREKKGPVISVRRSNILSIKAPEDRKRMGERHSVQRSLMNLSRINTKGTCTKVHHSETGKGKKKKTKS